jgi:aspartate-semialdehyde dehydrogenase
MDELSRQVVALLNGQTPPRKVFQNGLAFDLVPQIGEADDSGWSDWERTVSEDVLAMTGLHVQVTGVAVPLFRVSPHRSTFVRTGSSCWISFGGSFQMGV